MSVSDLEKAFSLIEQHQDQADFDGPKPEEWISSAESILGVKFPLTYRRFLAFYGCGDIAGQEFYGIIKNDFRHSGVPDAIWLTLDERKKSKLPLSFVIIYAASDGSYYALDCSRWSDVEECPIVVWIPGISKEGDCLEEIAEDYGKFLLETIEQVV